MYSTGTRRRRGFHSAIYTAWALENRGLIKRAWRGAGTSRWSLRTASR
jgi:hypothetical protein